MTIKNCEGCGKPLIRPPTRTHSYWATRRFCNNACQFSEEMKHARFLKNYDEDENGCWITRLEKNKNGYGIIVINKTVWIASRLSYYLHFGPIPDKMFICHHCDNPSCINPDHLYCGTPKKNMEDKVKRGRQHRPIGETNGMAKLTSEQALNILNDKRDNSIIAEELNVSEACIRSVKTGARWKSVFNKWREENGYL